MKRHLLIDIGAARTRIVCVGDAQLWNEPSAVMTTADKPPRILAIGADAGAAVIALAGNVACRSAERADAVDDKRLIARVVELIRGAIEDCMDKGRFNLVDDLAETGIVLTGGGALTVGLATAVSEALNCLVRVADKPQLAVIHGVAQVLPQLDFLQRRR